ncbi:hypothetical protein [Halobacteriovorax sp. JY17]|uniref:hypothetical protein n=1 Tax=Halobacteriovorax sp. JY17 TaxID=2014617 RepID=UPI000C3E9A67|nr:hypothetical protein [Halobacteriovorax sp. JY17]PIK14824.1 MAG: hypothetical protein CES88_10840 [Halobacteriovorax sp. JY17]
MRVDGFKRNIIKLKSIYILLFLLVLTSCVGTVEDKNEKTTFSSAGKTLEINFSGIEDAKAISHDKAEVSFFPASGGSGDYTYLIYRDGVVAPITYLDESLETNYKGLYKVTINGLKADTNYNFEVQVLDNETTARSLSTELRATTTYTKQSCDFYGIANVKLPPGLDSTSSIIVNWPEATVVGTPTKPFDGDPYQYVITLLDSDLLSADDMNDVSLNDSDGRFQYYQQSGNSKTIYGLQPNKKYFVQVRCEHVGYTNNKGDLTYKVESNTNILDITTSSGSAGDLVFEDGLFNVKLNSGDLGKQSFIASWKAAAGTFDHYRLYYRAGALTTGTVPPLCVYDGTTGTYCSKIAFDQTTAVVSGLVQDATYNVQLLVCVDANCTPENKKSSSIIPITMKPSLGVFGGITGILRGQNTNEVNKMKFKFDTPDFSTGVIDGLIVEWVDNSAGKILNDPDILNNTGISVNEDIDLTTDTEIEIDGFNPFASNDYCFNLYPYILNNSGVREYTPEGNPDVTSYCISTDLNTGVHIKMPDDLGATCLPTSSYSIRVDFLSPLSGVFSHYEVFWKKGNLASFNLNDAIAETAGYSRILVPNTDSSVELAPLLSGQNYTIGVVGYYFGADGNVYRTALNSSTVSECTTY